MSALTPFVPLLVALIGFPIALALSATKGEFGLLRRTERMLSLAEKLPEHSNERAMLEGRAASYIEAIVGFPRGVRLKRFLAVYFIWLPCIALLIWLGMFTDLTRWAVSGSAILQQRYRFPAWLATTTVIVGAVALFQWFSLAVAYSKVLIDYVRKRRAQQRQPVVRADVGDSG